MSSELKSPDVLIEASGNEFRDQQLRLVFDTMNDGVVVQNSAGKVIEFNRATLRILGLTADQILGKTSLDSSWRAINEDMSICPGPEHPAHLALTTGKRQTNRILGFQYGTQPVRWVTVDAVPLFRDHEAKPERVIVTFTDITELRRAREEEKDSERLIRTIIENVPGVISYWSADLRCEFANKAHAEMFGKTPEELAGLTFEDLLGADVAARTMPLVKKVLSGETFSFESPMVGLDGKSRDYWTQFVPDHQQGVVKGFFTLSLDVSRLKQAETEVALERGKMVAAAKMVSLGEMAGGVAHEINNPLAIISGKVEQLIELIAENGLEKDQVLPSLNVILKTTSRIAKVVRGLLAFSRDRAEKVFLDASLKQIVEDTVVLCEARFQHHGVSIRREMADIKLPCAAAEIAQVLMHLLNNSFDAVFGQSDKWVEIAVEQRDGSAYVTVTDSGREMDPLIVDKIMNPFFTTKPIGKGMGLGLSIASGIIKYHGGELRYDGHNPHTKFTFSLPLVRAVTPSSAA